MKKRKILKLRPDEWYGLASFVPDDEAYRIASIRLGVPPEKLEMRASEVAKLFRILEVEDDIVFARADQKNMINVNILRKRCSAQKKEIEALKQLAKGCKKHPNYRGRRKSKVKCEVCIILYTIYQKYVK